MKNLKKLALINMPGVASSISTIQTAFAKHKSLEILDLAGCNLPDYDSIVEILQKNKSIKEINLRGSSMTPDDLAYIWLGLRENLRVTNIDYQTEKVFLFLDTIQCVNAEMHLN